jgi:hypothetical protein
MTPVNWSSCPLSGFADGELAHDQEVVRIIEDLHRAIDQLVGDLGQHLDGQIGRNPRRTPVRVPGRAEDGDHQQDQKAAG